MDGMGTTTEQGWGHRERNILSSSSYVFVLPVVSINAKFIRILLKFRFFKSPSMSSTFCFNSGEFGRIIFGQFTTISTVANSNVIAYPFLISNPTRASKIAKPPWGNSLSRLHSQLHQAQVRQVRVIPFSPLW